MLHGAVIANYAIYDRYEQGSFFASDVYVVWPAEWNSSILPMVSLLETLRDLPITSIVSHETSRFLFTRRPLPGSTVGYTKDKAAGNLDVRSRGLYF